MAKNHQSDNPLFKALVKKYESDIASGFATMIVYFDSSVGIGEHPQHLEEMEESGVEIPFSTDRNPKPGVPSIFKGTAYLSKLVWKALDEVILSAKEEIL